MSATNTSLTPEQRSPHEMLLEALLKYSKNDNLNHLGNEMFRMFTEMGLPPDMFLDELKKKQPLDLLQTVYIVSAYQQAFLNHKRKAGATEKNVEATRRRNIDEIANLIAHGELGVY